MFKKLKIVVSNIPLRALPSDLMMKFNDLFSLNILNYDSISINFSLNILNYDSSSINFSLYQNVELLEPPYTRQSIMPINYFVPIPLKIYLYILLPLQYSLSSSLITNDINFKN